MYIPIELLKFLHPDEYYICQNGKLLNDTKDVKADSYYEVHLRLRGGKGGMV